MVQRRTPSRAERFRLIFSRSRVTHSRPAPKPIAACPPPEEEAPAGVAASPPQTTNPKILRRLERILLRGFLCALRVLAVDSGQRFHREDAKSAKKTLRRFVWLRLRRPKLSRNIRATLGSRMAFRCVFHLPILFLAMALF